MEAYRIETTLTANGSLVLDALPFRAGERVEVIVLGAPRPPTARESDPVQVTAHRSERPTQRVADDTCDVAP